MTALKLADMMVIGAMPPKLVKALAVIADTLHPAFESDPRIIPGISRESCVLCSLTVRDFLRAIGFANARVRPVVAIMIAWEGGEQLHSLGIGVPGTPRRPGVDDDRWIGHMVVWVPASRVLIDTTLYPTIRPYWRQLPPMLAVACTDEDGERVNGLRPIITMSLEDTDRAGYEFGMTYLDNPGNVAWHRGPDARDRARRRPVVEAMIARFGRWEG